MRPRIRDRRELLQVIFRARIGLELFVAQRYSCSAALIARRGEDRLAPLPTTAEFGRTRQD